MSSPLALVALSSTLILLLALSYATVASRGLGISEEASPTSLTPFFAALALVVAGTRGGGALESLAAPSAKFFAATSVALAAFFATTPLLHKNSSYGLDSRGALLLVTCLSSTSICLTSTLSRVLVLESLTISGLIILESASYCNSAFGRALLLFLTVSLAAALALLSAQASALAAPKLSSGLLLLGMSIKLGIPPFGAWLVRLYKDLSAPALGLYTLAYFSPNLLVGLPVLLSAAPTPVLAATAALAQLPLIRPNPSLGPALAYSSLTTLSLLVLLSSVAPWYL